MAAVNHSLHHVGQSNNEWAVNYNQNDVDTIREQILQTEAMKRRWLLLILIVAIAALAGAIALLSTNYALYSSSESSKKKLQEDNASPKSRADQTQQQLDVKTAKDTNDAQTRPEAP